MEETIRVSFEEGVFYMGDSFWLQKTIGREPRRKYNDVANDQFQVGQWWLNKWWTNTHWFPIYDDIIHSMSMSSFQYAIKSFIFKSTDTARQCRGSFFQI